MAVARRPAGERRGGAVVTPEAARLAVRRGGGRVDAVGSPADLWWLREQVAPFLTCEPAVATGEHWTVYAESAYVPGGTRGWVYSEKEARGEPPRRVWWSAERRAIAVDQPDAQWRRTYLVRHVRNTMRRAYPHRPHVFLHAAGVEIDGVGVVIVGGKRSGKTTTLLATLALTEPSVPVRLLGNDDVSLVLEGQKPIVLGWPRSIGVRRDSAIELIGWRPELAEGLGLADKLVGPADESLYVAYARVAHATRRTLAATSRLDLLVFPRFSDCDGACSPRLRRLPQREAYERLCTVGLQGGDRNDTFLEPHLPLAEPDASLAELISSCELPEAVELVQCMHRLVDSADAILRAADRAGESARLPAGGHVTSRATERAASGRP